MSKPVGKCVFCGGPGLTKSHVWPEWAEAILPESATHHEQIIGQFHTFTPKVQGPALTHISDTPLPLRMVDPAILSNSDQPQPQQPRRSPFVPGGPAELPFPPPTSTVELGAVDLLPAKPAKLVIGYQGTADALVHHGQAVIREGLVVHLASFRKSRH
jgi:hypothetical protein